MVQAQIRGICQDRAVNSEERRGEGGRTIGGDFPPNCPSLPLQSYEKPYCKDSLRRQLEKAPLEFSALLATFCRFFWGRYRFFSRKIVKHLLIIKTPLIAARSIFGMPVNSSNRRLLGNFWFASQLLIDQFFFGKRKLPKN